MDRFLHTLIESQLRVMWKFSAHGDSVQYPSLTFGAASGQKLCAQGSFDAQKTALREKKNLASGKSSAAFAASERLLWNRIKVGWLLQREM